MKIKLLLTVLFFAYFYSNAQTESFITGRWKLNISVETEFTTTDAANT